MWRHKWKALNILFTTKHIYGDASFVISTVPVLKGLEEVFEFVEHTLEN